MKNNDIKSREDIEIFVNDFYNKVDKEPLLGPVFNDVAQVDWEEHLPKLCDFWETVLLGKMKYKGNPMEAHINLLKQTSLTNEHFDRWLNLFYETIDETFEGPKAKEAKQRAHSIAGIMKHKIEFVTS